MRITDFKEDVNFSSQDYGNGAKMAWHGRTLTWNASGCSVVCRGDLLSCNTFEEEETDAQKIAQLEARVVELADACAKAQAQAAKERAHQAVNTEVLASICARLRGKDWFKTAQKIEDAIKFGILP